jgi:biopolymer transport protein ExbD
MTYDSPRRCSRRYFLLANLAVFIFGSLPLASEEIHPFPKTNNVVLVKADGIYFNGKLVSLAQLSVLLRRAKDANPSFSVRIVGNATTPYGPVAAVMRIATDLGVINGLATRRRQ